MTILVVMPLATKRGGGEDSLATLVQAGHPSGVEWIVVFLERGPMVGEFRARGVTVVVVDAGRLREPRRIIRAVTSIYRIARRERATVILGWMEKGHVYGGPAAMLARRPAVWAQLGTAQSRAWLGRLATAIPARGVITNSLAGARAQSALRPLRPVRAIYPGAELDRFDATRLAEPAEIRARLGLPAHGPLIGIVSRLQRWKGIHVLIDAMDSLRLSHPQVHCVVVGGRHKLEAGYADELERQVTELDLEAHVTFAGFQANVPEWMQAMDIVVHASDHEPFGIVVIEAMALGKPVIAGAGGGPSEFLTDGVDGVLVAYGDSAALATALRRYIDDPEYAAKVGMAGARLASEFSTETYKHKVIDAVRELCARPKS